MKLDTPYSDKPGNDILIFRIPTNRGMKFDNDVKDWVTSRFLTKQGMTLFGK